MEPRGGTCWTTWYDRGFSLALLPYPIERVCLFLSLPLKAADTEKKFTFVVDDDEDDDDDDGSLVHHHPQNDNVVVVLVVELVIVVIVQFFGLEW